MLMLFMGHTAAADSIQAWDPLALVLSSGLQ